MKQNHLIDNLIRNRVYLIQLSAGERERVIAGRFRQLDWVSLTVGSLVALHHAANGRI